jgi:hypothetical protein
MSIVWLGPDGPFLATYQKTNHSKFNLYGRVGILPKSFELLVTGWERFD